MEAKKMTRKETLAYILEVVHLYNRYLYEIKEHDADSAKNNALTTFKVFDLAYNTKRGTIPRLLDLIYSEIEYVARARYEAFPKLPDLIAKRNKAMDKCTDAKERLHRSIGKRIDAILSRHKLTLRMGDWSINDCYLVHPDNAFTTVHLCRARNPERFEYMKACDVDYISFTDEETRLMQISYLKDIVKLAEDNALRQKLYDTIVEGQTELTVLKEKENRINDEYKKNLRSMVYNQLRTFAKDILDFDLPETI